MMKVNEWLGYMVKGVAMGVANVIPGVSGGTIALITNIFERLIHALKSINGHAFKLLLKGRFKEFSQHTDLYFLISVFLGVGIAIISVARLFDYLFQHYPVYIWAYFFGLILASVYFVGKTIEKWSLWVIVSLIAGAAFAWFITTMKPATQNEDFLYLIICGVVAVCSMILPGLSGSFVLILMGNYQLIAIDAINQLRMDILLPVLLGAVVGLLAFSHFLSWVFRKFRNETIGLLTGFILGSVGVLWPWKKTIYLLDAAGEQVLKKGAPVVQRFENIWPASINTEVVLAVTFMVLGIVSIWLIEVTALRKEKQKRSA
ncbi:MAG TPA: DUF368 domain-containing protein [Bacteroidales bacterium]|nr:DUF368 domain-containing protein [Bacteroidales bacterium]